jgi:hypothetical protein
VAARRAAYLAARLSEDPACRVLLVESGTTTGLEEASRIPGMALTLLAGEAAWPDLTAAQSALDDRRSTSPRDVA